MLALLYDVHGNLPALEAVLADAERAGEVELRRVEYDHRAAVTAIRQRMGPWAEVLAGRLERARF